MKLVIIGRSAVNEVNFKEVYKMTDENTEALEIYRIDPKKRNLK
jgi:hypothetical protein